jgi:hypothetical protein
MVKRELRGDETLPEVIIRRCGSPAVAAFGGPRPPPGKGGARGQERQDVPRRQKRGNVVPRHVGKEPAERRRTAGAVLAVAVLGTNE